MAGTAPPTEHNHRDQFEPPLRADDPGGILGAARTEARRAHRRSAAAELPHAERIPSAQALPIAQGPANAQEPANATARTEPSALSDSRTRGFRLRVAVAGIVGLAGLWGALAFLRDYALHKPVPQPIAAEVSLANVHSHPQPTYTVLFMMLSYSVVLIGIVCATAAHDASATRLRIARERVAETIKDYDRAIAQRVTTPLKVEQAHRDLVDLAPSRIEAIRQEHLRWAIDSVTKSKSTPENGGWWESNTHLGDPLHSVPSPAQTHTEERAQ